jgi:hypothetical protein
MVWKGITHNPPHEMHFYWYQPSHNNTMHTITMTKLSGHIKVLHHPVNHSIITEEKRDLLVECSLVNLRWYWLTSESITATNLHNGNKMRQT